MTPDALAHLTRPLSVWTAIRLPLLALARHDPDVAARRRAKIASEGRLCGVEASACAGCGTAVDDLYVVVGSDPKGPRVGLCRGCVDSIGSRALSWQATCKDRDYGRLQRRVTPRGETLSKKGR